MYSSHSMSHRVHETQPHASPPFITKRNFRHSCVSSKVPTIFHPTPKGITAIRGGNLIFFFACKTSLLARCIRAWRGERSVFCMYTGRISWLLCVRLHPDPPFPVGLELANLDKTRESKESGKDLLATRTRSHRNSLLPLVYHAFLKLEYLQIPLQDIAYTGREVFLEKIE